MARAPTAIGTRTMPTRKKNWTAPARAGETGQRLSSVKYDPVEEGDDRGSDEKRDHGYSSVLERRDPPSSTSEPSSRDARDVATYSVADSDTAARTHVSASTKGSSASGSTGSTAESPPTVRHRRRRSRATSGRSHRGTAKLAGTGHDLRKGKGDGACDVPPGTCTVSVHIVVGDVLGSGENRGK